ncbi:MAG: glycogen debranching N-terminal domain-containing protein [Oryzihumus sp.]
MPEPAAPATPVRPGEPQQPWLYDLSICVSGNVTALSAASGQVEGAGAQGVFVDDRRVLSVLDIRLGDQATAPVAAASAGPRSEFLGSARHLGNPGSDPTVEVLRRREVVAQGVREQVEVRSRADVPVVADLLVRLAGDAAPISRVKSGIAEGTPLPAMVRDGQVTWGDEDHEVVVSFDPAPSQLSAGAHGAVASFPLEVPPGDRATVTLTLLVARRGTSGLDADGGAARLDWDDVAVEADDPRLGPALAMGMTDLRHLTLTDPQAPADVYAGAGTPWYLTLFGRDSLWAARMALPFGTTLAGGTLRALARRQGTVLDAVSAQAPGKIPHEVRRTAYVDEVKGLALPPVYYGTIDATPLWVSLLHDAWLWGLPEAEVVALLPHLRAATRWLTEHAAPDDDGLLKYLDTTGTGLANQGWKDSADSVRWRDGRVADGPIALVEAQAYAVEAADAAATLFDAFGQDGAAELRAWADGLRTRFRQRYWAEGAEGPYLGIAVDGHGALVDGVGSNMGHVLGTGTLDPDEAARVSATLSGPTMLGRYGIGTLATDNGGYNPIGYHTGSVWTHDTAICALGMVREGHRDPAVAVGRSLLAAAVPFGYRWPELYAGSGVLDRPAPYPASCRPQAWSAASAAALLTVALGFEPDAPAGRLVLRPARPAAYGAMTVHGLRFVGHRFGVRCLADGTTEVLGAPSEVAITVA